MNRVCVTFFDRDEAKRVLEWDYIHGWTLSILNRYSVLDFFAASPTKRLAS